MSIRKHRSKRDDAPFTYSKINVPKMKSVFWKYFGFPADENNDIITKQKVICTLCKTVLTNHYNTTNIRAHIQSTHKLIFSQLVTTHGISIPPRKATNATKKPIKPQSKSYEEVDIQNSSFSRSHCSSKEVKIDYSDASFIEEDSSNLMPLTYEDTDDHDVMSKDDMTITETLNVMSDHTEENQCVSPSNAFVKHKVLAPLNISVDINPIQVDYNIEEALTKMIVKDLLNVSSIYSCGMEGFVTSFLSNQILPPLSKMELAIKNLHSNKFEKLKDRIKIHSQVKSYSLSFDVWTNIEGKQFVSIYYNNISEEFENQFCDNLYMTIELTNYTLFEPIFNGFNLQNCSAAVVNTNHEIINTFLSSNDIPIVHCFSYIINNCISNIFEIPEVASILDEISDVMARYASEISSEEIDLPLACQEFAISKLHVLRFFCESVSWPEEVEFLIAKAKQILDVLSPLDITLETLKEEDIPLSSLFLPFAEKIIDKHYAYSEFDDSLMQEVKAIVVKQFKSSVCSNNHLIVTAMLDPRFHKFLSLKNLNTCLNILEKKYRQMGKQRSSLQKCEPTKDEPPKNSRKTHLKMFFDDCLEDTPTKSFKNEHSIETDLRRYREEAFASLEESPIEWWNQWGNSYGSLRHLSEAYYCILGFVNLRLKEPFKYQISNHRRRFIMTGKLIDQILFLNKNA